MKYVSTWMYRVFSCSTFQITITWFFFVYLKNNNKQQQRFDEPVVEERCL